MNGNLLALSLALIASPYPAAAELRDFCSDRPGLGTPPCTIDRGHFAVELGALDWTMSRQDGVREDRIGAAETLVRYGLSDSLEVQLGWQGVAYVRERAPDGFVSHRAGAGDITVAVRGNLRNPDGSGVSVALMPFVTLPTGERAIGETNWTAGMIVPVSYALSDKIQVAFTASTPTAPTSNFISVSRNASERAVAQEGLDSTLEHSNLDISNG